MKFFVYPHEPFNKTYPYGSDNGAIGFFTDSPVLRTITSERDGDYLIVPFAISINQGDSPAYMQWCNELIEKHCGNVDERHIFFHVGDCDQIPEIARKSLWFNASPGDGIPFFLPVRLTPELSDIENAFYDVSFQGTFVTHPIRNRIPEIIGECEANGLRCFLKETSDFYRRIPEHWKLRNQYLQVIKDSKFVLCPKGWGHNSYRFFETLALGKIPILISDQVRLPLETRIDYDRFVVKIPEEDVGRTSGYLKEFTESHDLRESSVLAHNTHQQYFANTHRFLDAYFPTGATGFPLPLPSTLNGQTVPM